MTFARRGHRRKPGYGLYYKSDCGRFAVYRSDQAAGVPLPLRWLAVELLPTPRIISRHRRRTRAETACRRAGRMRAN